MTKKSAKKKKRRDVVNIEKKAWLRHISILKTLLSTSVGCGFGRIGLLQIYVSYVLKKKKLWVYYSSQVQGHVFKYTIFFFLVLPSISFFHFFSHSFSVVFNLLHIYHFCKNDKNRKRKILFIDFFGYLKLVFKASNFSIFKFYTILYCLYNIIINYS